MGILHVPYGTKDLCVCGHVAEQHCLSSYPDHTGRWNIDKCEVHGHRENAGMRYVEDQPGGEGRWVEHCIKFELAKKS